MSLKKNINAMTTDELHGEMVAIAERNSRVLSDAAAEGRSLTNAEQAAIDDDSRLFDELEARIKAQVTGRRVESMSVSEGRRSMPEGAEAGGRRITGGEPAARNQPSWGFNSPGDFMRSVFNSTRGVNDRRLMNAASSFGSEGVNEDGGFAVPPDFRAQILSLVRGDDSLMGLCDQQTTGSNALTLPLDSSAPHDSNGVAVSWEAEAATLTPSKPKLSSISCRLHKLAALIPLSDELMEDAPAVASWLPVKVGTKFNAKLNDAIVSGDGVGKPQGLLNAPSKITVNKEGSQTAATINLQNILKMWARLPTGSRMNAVWVVHPDVEQQLQQLTLPGTNPSPGIFLPGGSIINAGASTLLGRPLVVTEAAQALGTEGDIILTDLKQYLVAQKVSGLKADVSIHAYFDQGLTAFRFTMRVGGMSYWPAAVARQNGSSTASPIVTLQTRS